MWVYSYNSNVIISGSSVFQYNWVWLMLRQVPVGMESSIVDSSRSTADVNAKNRGTWICTTIVCCNTWIFWAAAEKFKYANSKNKCCAVEGRLRFWSSSTNLREHCEFTSLPISVKLMPRIGFHTLQFFSLWNRMMTPYSEWTVFFI